MRAFETAAINALQTSGSPDVMKRARDSLDVRWLMSRGRRYVHYARRAIGFGGRFDVLSFTDWSRNLNEFTGGGRSPAERPRHAPTHVRACSAAHAHTFSGQKNPDVLQLHEHHTDADYA
jgi:hypothetical protein